MCYSVVRQITAERRKWKRFGEATKEQVLAVRWQFCALLLLITYGLTKRVDKDSVGNTVCPTELGLGARQDARYPAASGPIADGFGFWAVHVGHRARAGHGGDLLRTHAPKQADTGEKEANREWLWTSRWATP